MYKRKMGKKLTVFLIDGKEFGPKIIEIGNWVGKGIYSPRISLVELLNKRVEFSNPGIYFLKSKKFSYGQAKKTHAAGILQTENKIVNLQERK
ncbi:MAG: hypothetical protein GXX85_12260 [Ignavibacteria bacterium]|nr:hypothetical protein [Ignavibacteria bacterium]